MEKMNNNAIWVTAFICMAFGINIYVAKGYDPGLLQDFCIGVDDPNSAVFVNGKFCKNPDKVTSKDFWHKAWFDIPSNTDNIYGVGLNIVDINAFPAVNTMGLAMARVDFAPSGVNPPHLHPRASEILVVLEGTLYAGIVTSDFYKLYEVILRQGDMMVFPQGLVHFQLNIGNTHAVSIVSFSSQHQGRVDVAAGAFGTWPPIRNDVLTKAFQVNETVIDQLRSQFFFNARHNISLNDLIEDH